MAVPVAYLRRSRVDSARPGAVSYEEQLAAVRALATKHGDDPDAMVILEDWGKSGRAEKQAGRAAYARLEAMVQSGEATAVYSFNLSRLARSLEVLSRLTKQCADAGIPIRCADGHSPDVTNATGRMVLSILGAVNQWQAEWTAERAAEGAAIRRARGDHMGPAPYGARVQGGQLEDRPTEDPDVVLAAYRVAGTFQGTARLLTAQGTPSRTGRPWAPSTVRGILTRVAPDELPIQPKRGRPPRRTFMLGGLLRCQCGMTLTGRLERSGSIAYDCRRGWQDGHGHPRQVAERDIIGWIKAEAARFEPPGGRLLIQESADQGRKNQLEEKRRRTIEAFLETMIDKAERDQRLVEIGDELAMLAATERIVDIPEAIDWTKPPAAINYVLTGYWKAVELDHQLRPIRAMWLIPEDWLRPRLEVAQ